MPKLKNNSHSIKPLLAPLFTALASIISVPGFPIFIPFDQNKLSSQKQNLNLKYRADFLGSLPIQKTVRVFFEKIEIDVQMREILDILYTLLAIVEKQNQEIAKLKEFVKKSIAIKAAMPEIQPKRKETIAFQLAFSLLNLTPLANKNFSSTNSKL